MYICMPQKVVVRKKSMSEKIQMSSSRQNVDVRKKSNVVVPPKCGCPKKFKCLLTLCEYTGAKT